MRCRCWSLSWESMTTHSSILAWRIRWTKEPGGLQFVRSQRIRHDWNLQKVSSGFLNGANMHKCTCEPRLWNSTWISFTDQNVSPFKIKTLSSLSAVSTSLFLVSSHFSSLPLFPLTCSVFVKLPPPWPIYSLAFSSEYRIFFSQRSFFWDQALQPGLGSALGQSNWEKKELSHGL